MRRCHSKRFRRSWENEFHRCPWSSLATLGKHRQIESGNRCSNQLDLCGTSGLAPFYLSMKRGLDVLLAHKHADASRVAVAGLSGGGRQTNFIRLLDTRAAVGPTLWGALYVSWSRSAEHSNHRKITNNEHTLKLRISYFIIKRMR